MTQIIFMEIFLFIISNPKFITPPKSYQLKPLLIFTFAFFIFGNAFSQTNSLDLKVKGSVIDSVSGKPLPYVTVALQDAKTKTSIKSAISKDDGSFEIVAAKDKSYLLVLAFTGYTSKTIELKNESTDIGKIILAPSSKQMKEV